uniref:hypothetical protein n=1 Tax=Ornithobacterium rhinotracheale TaxID=28251 RepID=UPI001C873F2D
PIFERGTYGFNFLFYAFFNFAEDNPAFTRKITNTSLLIKIIAEFSYNLIVCIIFINFGIN